MHKTNSKANFGICAISLISKGENAMKRFLLALAVLGVTAAGGNAICDDGNEEAKTKPAPASQADSVWMRTKLQYSQNIFTSLARADVGAISLEAKRLRALNWWEKVAHHKDAAYQEQLKAFQAANDKLIHAAEKKNLDGCTLAFVQMTFSCTACHQRLRDTQPK
jgi:hypothetical protein